MKLGFVIGVLLAWIADDVFITCEANGKPWGSYVTHYHRLGPLSWLRSHTL